MNVLVTGASGQLGLEVCRELRRRGIRFLAQSHGELDITDAQAVERCVAAWRPSVLLHCAAYTAVDRAEQEPQTAFRVNARGTEIVAEAARRAGAKLVYLSTDYVFSGDGGAPYRTDAPTGPLNAYGSSKLAGEEAVRAAGPRHFIVRTSWVFGEHGSNFVKTVLRLGLTRERLDVVDDQVGGPTYARDLARLLCGMAATERYGTYHAANEGFCSRAELAAQALLLAGISCEVRGVPTAALPSPARRPLDSRLDTSSLTGAGFPLLPPWREALERCVRRIAPDGLSP